MIGMASTYCQKYSWT